MRGGTRSNRRIFPDSVHSLMSNNANSIRNGLERMDPNERFQVYIDVQKNDEPENIRLFKDIFREEYPLEFTLANKRMLDMVADSGAFPTGMGMGGKTRRNRNRKRRGRGRRSSKHYSNRR